MFVVAIVRSRSHEATSTADRYLVPPITRAECSFRAPPSHDKLALREGRSALDGTKQAHSAPNEALCPSLAASPDRLV